VKISSLITPERIVDLKAATKREALREMFKVIEKAPEITNSKDFERSIIEREDILTTGIGFEIAVPHVKIESVSSFVMALGRSRQGVDFDSLDGKPVKLVIMIATSARERDEFLKVLAKVVLLFKEESFRRKILKAGSPEEVFALLKRH
jgi:fructose-specific phosphotransferase system IIA component